jgi:hypothetical protein
MTRRGLLAGAATVMWAQSPITLGSRRELFVDRHLIGEMRGTELRLGQPVDAGVAFRFDKPWEGRFCNYATVIDGGGKVRLYYRGVPNAGEDGRGDEVYCYAESPDGKEFVRPKLGLHSVRGTRINNVILAGTPPLQHNFSPFRDRDGSYQALAGTSKSGLIAFRSRDGVKWEKLREEAVLTGGAFDSQNLAFWSEAEGQYVCYYRTFKKIGNENYRWVSRATSRDFLNWNKEGELQFGDAPPEHLYTNQTSAYFRAPHLYVSLCARFLPGRQVLTEAEAKAIGVDPGYFKDCSDAVLMSSRGGLQFDRTFLEAFLRPGLGMKNWVSRSNYPALNVIATGDEMMSFYVVRDYGQRTIHLRRYELRLDGFASLYGGYRGGEMRSKAFTFAGSQLELNYSTSAPGGVKILLEDLEGKLLAESVELVGDQTSRVVRWKGMDGVGALAGRAVRMRVQLKDGNLYSFRFL